MLKDGMTERLSWNQLSGDGTTDRLSWNQLSGDCLISTQLIPRQHSDDPRGRNALEPDLHASWEHGCTIASMVTMIPVDYMVDHKGSVDVAEQ